MYYIAVIIVALYTSAWIEIVKINSGIRYPQSHSTRVRGLK